MKRYTSVMLSPFFLLACSDEHWESLRSSKNIPTENMSLHVVAGVHTHLGQEGEADETHTTLSAELYGDEGGYAYYIDLAEADQLSAGVNGATTPLKAIPFPSEQDRQTVYYYEDFAETEPNTAFQVSLSRAETVVNSVPVTLLDDAAFAVSPADAEVPLTQLLTLEWTDMEAYGYWLVFDLRCETIDGSFYSRRARFPNADVESIASPFTFNPVNFFTKPDPEKVTRCELDSSLYSIEEQAAPIDTTFRFVSVRSIRQHHTEKILTLTE